MNQWDVGLRYDHENFRIRMPNPAGTAAVTDGAVHGAAAGAAPGIHFNQTEETIRFMNVPRARFLIHVFEYGNDYPATPVAIHQMPMLNQTLTGVNSEWQMVRVLDLRTLALDPGRYHIRVQAVPNVMEPVRGMSPTTYWGASSSLTATGAHLVVELTSVPPLRLNAPVLTLAAAPIPAPSNALHTISWDAVPGASNYRFFVFDNPNETNPLNALRVIENITVLQQTLSPFGSNVILPFEPLPDGNYFIRVQAIPADSTLNSPSPLSLATAGIRLTRRLNVPQMLQLINTHGGVENGNYIVVDIRNAFMEGANHAGSYGDSGSLTEWSNWNTTDSIIIPFPNAGLTVAVPPSLTLAERQANFFVRFADEIRAHPNYVGPDTLVLLY